MSLVLKLLKIIPVVATLQDPTPTKEPEQWLRFFRALPQARELCQQHLIGHTGGERSDISFTLYATAKPPEHVARFYSLAHEVPLEPPGDTITVKSEDGSKVLSVFPVSAPHPECGVKPLATERTVIVVSFKHP